MPHMLKRILKHTCGLRHPAPPGVHHSVVRREKRTLPGVPLTGGLLTRCRRARTLLLLLLAAGGARRHALLKHLKEAP